MSLVKSKQRVKDHGEVFTPEHIVKDMCDLVKDDILDFKTNIFEPTCGNGNFLVEIFDRRMKQCYSLKDKIQATISVYGVDIQQDNVEESIMRCKDIIGEEPILLYVLENNIILGNILEPTTFNVSEWSLDNTYLYHHKILFDDVIKYKVDKEIIVEPKIIYQPIEWDKEFVIPEIETTAGDNKELTVFEEMFG